MVDMGYFLGRKYALLQQQAAGGAPARTAPTMPIAPTPATITTGQTAGQVTDAFLTGQGVTTNNVGDTSYTQYGKGGMTVIRPGQGSMIGKITSLASAGYDIEKAARAVAGAAAAKLDNVSADLKPEESATENAQRRATTRQIGVRTDLMPAESASEISYRGAQSRNFDAQTAVTRREGLEPDDTASTAVMLRMMDAFPSMFDPRYRLSGK